MVSSFEHFNKPLGSIKGEELHEKLNELASETDSTTWDQLVSNSVCHVGHSALRIAYRCRRLTQFSHALSYDSEHCVTELL